MIALIATYYVVAYLLVPGSIFGGFSSLFIPLKNFHRTRTQEVTFAVVAALLPFVLALVAVWYLPFATAHPFHVSGSAADRRADYKTLFAGAYSEKSFEGQTATFWAAATRIGRRQSRFLFWYYLLVLVESGAFAALIRKYGQWKSNCVYAWLADNVMLLGVSEWPMLFEEFISPDQPKIEVWVDILTQQDVLYRGKLGDYFLDSEGALTGLLLDDPDRFNRQAYVEAVKAKEYPKEQREQLKEKYWRKIPSADLYIPFSQIQNINVRRELATIAEGTTQLLQKENIELEVQEVGDDPPAIPDNWTE